MVEAEPGMIAQDTGCQHAINAENSRSRLQKKPCSVESDARGCACDDGDLNRQLPGHAAKTYGTPYSAGRS
jgi:hypothetical protein